MPYKRRAPARKGKRVYRKRVYRKRKYVRKGSTALVRTVKKVLAKNVETKVCQTGASLVCRVISSSQSQANFNAGCWMVTPQGANLGGAVIQAYPIISNGVGADQRIGDEIKIKGTYINYLMNASDYDAATNPNPRATLATIWVVRPKRSNNAGLLITDIQAGTSANFFEFNSGSESGFIGSTYDMLKKVDRDNWQILACRTHKIGYSGSLNGTNVVSTLQNNDFKQFYRGRIKLKGMTWKVDRNEFYQGQPIYMFVQVTPVDGTTYNTNIIPIDFVFNQTTYYVDA